MDLRGKRILIVGNADSIHIYNYIMNLLLDTGIDITIYDRVGPKEHIRAEYVSFFEENNVKIVSGPSPVQINRVSYPFFLLKTYKIIKSLGHFDYLQFHFVQETIAPVFYLLRKRFEKIILTYWGSDLFRLNDVRRSLTAGLIGSADHIVMLTSDMVDYFKNLPSKYSKNAHKCTVVDFGNMFYPGIDELKQSYKDISIIKSQIGLDPNKYTITIGYVWRKPMRQYETVLALLEGKKNYLNKIQIVLPVWGIPDDEYEKLDNLLNQSGVSYKMFRDFMGPDMVVKFRVSTDIFIHTQTTDALSSAMMEHLYAGTVVINGKWLNYGMLDEKGVYYLKVDSIEDVDPLLETVIASLDEYKEKTLINHDILRDFSSWEAYREKWLSLYK